MEIYKHDNIPANKKQCCLERCEGEDYVDSCSKNLEDFLDHEEYC